MYISSFRIDGFGIFSNVEVENLPPGLSIFFGQNEAGKSTCLEFLRAMLTGYPESARLRRRFAPLAGGKAGGGLILNDTGSNDDKGEIRLTRRPEAGGLSLYGGDGEILPDDVLSSLLSGVNKEVYRKVFGFSLGELENFESLNAEGVRNALYGASFGPGLRSPQEALKILKHRREEIFKPAGSKQELNSALRQLGDLRARIMEMRENSACYDSLRMELESRKKELASLRERRLALDDERRELERRLGVWQQWDQWRVLKARLEEMIPANSDFPEDAVERLARLEESRDACERQLAARREKISLLRARRDSEKVDEALLAELPALHRLAERKSGYHQALAQLDGQKESLERAKNDLDMNLGQLGPGWDCQRIRATDRSLFAREDLEKRAREMNAAMLAHQAAMDYLGKTNSDVESAQTTLNAASKALEAMPEASAPLNDHERDDLRQNVARLEESRRLEPGREKALSIARGAFTRALEQTRILISSQENDANEGQPEARAILDTLLARQDDALALANEIQKHLAEESQADNVLKHAEAAAEEIKIRMDNLRSSRQDSMGPSRDDLDNRARALRNLRAVSSKLATEKERLEELETRINGEKTPKRIRNWATLVFAIIFLVGGFAIFAASWFWHISELTIGGEVAIPINRWGAYIAIVCGVALLGAGLPGNGAEKKRHNIWLRQMRERADACRTRIAEYEAQINKLCVEAEVDGYDPITLDASEMLLEREREQCFQEERERREMDTLKGELTKARTRIIDLQKNAQEKEGEVQKVRRRWHGLMQGLGVEVVPSPESAATFFARAEAARLAAENVANARRELDALWEDLHLLEKGIAETPAIAEQLANSPEPLSLEEAVRQVLESCRGADMIRDQKIRAKAELETARNEMARAQSRQREASAQLDSASERLATARASWSDRLNGFGLGDNLDPETVREAFKYMENCLAAENRMAHARADLDRNANELAAMRDPLAEILGRLGREPNLAADGQADWLITLDNLLSDAESAEKIRDERGGIEKRLVEEEEELGSEEAAFAQAKSRERALLAQAGVGSPEELLKVARQHTERRELERALGNLESTLAIAADSMPLAEFLQSFKADQKDIQESRLKAVIAERDGVGDAEGEVATSVGALSARVHAIMDADDLANLRQDECMLEESVAKMAREWSKLALAEALILKAKGIYESERQPEVIRMASRIFSQITNGRWLGISSSLEDSRLQIIPPHGEPVDPECLSRGAQEQAYLALRLAYIRSHARHARSLPVIMDEILVNFDPERAERAARTFADLASGQEGGPQQIFYFTCQPQMVDMLKKAAPEARLCLVENRNIRVA